MFYPPDPWVLLNSITAEQYTLLGLGICAVILLTWVVKTQEKNTIAILVETNKD